MRMLYKQDTVHKVTKHKCTISVNLKNRASYI